MADLKQKLDYIKRYTKLGWKVILLDGKRPITKGWTKNPPGITEISKTLSKNPQLNVGVITGELSGIIAIDVDQPKLVGYNPNPVIEKGVLAHSTSKAPRLIFRSSNPEVLGFSKKVMIKKEELTEAQKKLLLGDWENKESITLIEVLGDGRQFMAPPSVHPTTSQKLEWITPLPEKLEDVLEIKDLNELKQVLAECIDDKEVILRLFEEEKLRETSKFSKDVLEGWLAEILKELKNRGKLAEDRGSYIRAHCPFHEPDNNPSFAIYRNTFLAIDFHDWKVYSLKELAKELGIFLKGGKIKNKGGNHPWEEGEVSVGEIEELNTAFSEGGKGGNGSHPQIYPSDSEKIPEQITIDFLEMQTKHLPRYNELDEIVGLVGEEYTPIIKAYYYCVISWKYRRSLVFVGKLYTDARIHLMLRMLSGTGKFNLKTATQRLCKELGLWYGSPTSLHPEQLIGKVIRDRRKKDQFEEIDGYLDRDVVVLDEDKNYIDSEDLRYSEIRAYIRIAKDTYGGNRMEKKLVDVPSEHAIEKYPSCVIIQFGQPIPIPEARVNEGDLGRDIIPFVDFEDIDQSEILRRRVLESHIDVNKAVKRFCDFWQSLPEVDFFTMDDDAKALFVELSDVLYRYGMQFSPKVADYTQKKKTRIQNNFIKLCAIQAAINGRNVISKEDVEIAFIDFFEFQTLEFNLIDRFLVLDENKAWLGVKRGEDRRCLEWLIEKGAVSEETSNVTIREYVSAISKICGCKEEAARKRYYKQLENGWIESKQVGKTETKVWLKLKPRIKRIASKEFVVEAYKTYKGLVEKCISRYGEHYHPYHPCSNSAEKPLIEEKSTDNEAKGFTTHLPPMKNVSEKKGVEASVSETNPEKLSSRVVKPDFTKQISQEELVQAIKEAVKPAIEKWEKEQKQRGVSREQIKFNILSEVLRRFPSLSSEKVLFYVEKLRKKGEIFW